jgi:hypothetical protein
MRRGSRTVPRWGHGRLAAARLLQKMGAETAIDSGSATVWSAAGHGGCPHPWQDGSCFGLTQRVGLHWQRPVVSVSVLSYVRSSAARL